MSLNSALTLSALVGVVIFVVVFWVKSRVGANEVNDEELNTFGRIMDYVRMKMLELENEESNPDDSDEKFRRDNRRRARFKNALTGSVHGKDDAKTIVIDRIRAIIAENVEPRIAKNILGLDDSPPVENKFEVLLYRYKKKYGKQALSELITKYGWDRLRGDEPYYITGDDIHYAWEREEILLSDHEMFEVLAVLIFQRYKGFGVVDTIREMDIDGLSGGVSGAVLPHAKKDLPSEKRTESSVWINYRGKEIHMRFLTFGDEGEMRRITQALLSYGSKGSLTRNRGVMVCNSWDGARITAVCPPASRSWTFFVRKFGYMGKSPEELIVTADNNGMLVVNILRYLMLGEVSMALSGGQGSGKSTLMSSITRFIDPRYTIRTLEMSFELDLRDLYPDRDIVELQETQFVSSELLQDTMKKMNGMVSFAGEVATSAVAVRMIQFAQVASLFTVFTYHAEEAEDVPIALRDQLMDSGVYKDLNIAEKQVAKVVKMVVILRKRADGLRYIERVSEIIPIINREPYPEYVKGDPDSINEITRRYYMESSEKRNFVTNDIIIYHSESGKYRAANRFSETLTKHMVSRMDKDTATEFAYFMDRHFKKGAGMA